MNILHEDVKNKVRAGVKRAQDLPHGAKELGISFAKKIDDVRYDIRHPNITDDMVLRAAVQLCHQQDKSWADLIEVERVQFLTEADMVLNAALRGTTKV